MTNSNLHISRNAQLPHVRVDDVTTLPSMFVSIYGGNQPSKKSFGDSGKQSGVIAVFYTYYYKKYKLHTAITKANKVTYGNHIRCVGGFFRYLNFRHMNLKYQNMSLIVAHEINTTSRYKSIAEQQYIQLNNMLIPFLTYLSHKIIKLLGFRYS